MVRENCIPRLNLIIRNGNGGNVVPMVVPQLTGKLASKRGVARKLKLVFGTDYFESFSLTHIQGSRYFLAQRFWVLCFEM